MKEEAPTGRVHQVHQDVQQQHQPKLDADPSSWFSALLTGATLERLRLEVRIRKLQQSLRTLEFVALVLSVASATTLFAALAKAFDLSQTTAIVAAGLLNFATILVAGLKKFVEDHGKLTKYHVLDDQYGDFILKVTDPASRRTPRAVADQYRKLRQSTVRTAPEISSEKPWDRMTDEEREQYLQQRIGQ